MLLQNARQQVPAGNLHLLLHKVAGNLNNLHAVQKRLRQCRQCVRSGNEQHVRQVEINVDIIIVEMAVLLRVEHLEQRGRRITFEIRTYLIHLVKEDNRV